MHGINKDIPSLSLYSTISLNTLAPRLPSLIEVNLFINHILNIVYSIYLYYNRSTVYIYKPVVLIKKITLVFR